MVGDDGNSEGQNEGPEPGVMAQRLEHWLLFQGPRVRVSAPTWCLTVLSNFRCLGL